MFRQATKRATILDVIKDPWVIKFQTEQASQEIRLLEAMCQPPLGATATNRHQSMEIHS